MESGLDLRYHGAMILGAHLSISGGLHKALESAKRYDFSAVALFVRNQVQWKCRALSEEAVESFLATRRQVDVKKIVAHASYLVNLAGNSEVRPKSIAAMVEDLSRCQRLGIEYLVFHPGSNPDNELGIRLIAEALDEIIGQAPAGETRILLETTAGQGNCIGHRFEHLRDILAASESCGRLGVCLDTCHVFAAGYDLRSQEGYLETMEEFDRVIGLDSLYAVHVNDSKKPFASRVDRHEHIGQGYLGLDAFKFLVQDSRLREVPLILETPKGTDESGQDWDLRNADLLRKLAGCRGVG